MIHEATRSNDKVVLLKKRKHFLIIKPEAVQVQENWQGGEGVLLNTGDEIRRQVQVVELVEAVEELRADGCQKIALENSNNIRVQEEKKRIGKIIHSFNSSLY